jgi:hypothetical protein
VTLAEYVGFAVAWYAAGLVGAGWVFSMAQSKFPELAESDRRQDAGYACLFAFGGPVTLVVSFFVSGFGQYGWWRKAGSGG